MSNYHFANVTKVSSPLQLVLHLPMTFPRFQNLLLSVGPDSPTILVEARCGEQLIGVGLATLKKTHGQGEILSVFVDAQYRRQGVGTRLLTELEQTLAARCAVTIKLGYQTGQPTTAALEHILHKCQWSEPETVLNMCVTNNELIKDAPWLKHRPLHEDFSLFMWATLSQADREAIQAKQRDEAWYPELVSPFFDEHIMEPVSSIGVRHNASGDIAGWMVTHRISSQSVQFTSLFVSPPYRYYDLGMFLTIESIKLQSETNVFTKGMWPFQPDNKSTTRFTERYLKPYLTAYNQIKHAYKTLSAETA